MPVAVDTALIFIFFICTLSVLFATQFSPFSSKVSVFLEAEFRCSVSGHE